MALSLVQHKVAQTTASQLTVAVTVTSTAVGALLVVCTGNNGTRTVVSVTDNATGGSNTYVQASGAAGTTGVDQTDVWYCLSAAHAGATTVTVTFSGVAGTFNKEAWVFEVSGFTSAAFDLAANVTNGTGVASTDTGASVTTTSTTGFLVGVITTSFTIAANPKAGNEFTSGGDISATSDAACSLISSTATAHQPVWTDGTATASFCSSTAAFKEASGGFVPDEDYWIPPVIPPVDPIVTVF